MPWLLTSPGHQQPRYWLYRICRSFSWGRIWSTCVMSMWSNDTKCKYMFMYLLKNSACKRLRQIPDNRHHISPMTMRDYVFIVSSKSDCVLSQSLHCCMQYHVILNCIVMVPKDSMFIYHIEAEARWPPFSEWHFQTHFHEWAFINCE